MSSGVSRTQQGRVDGTGAKIEVRAVCFTPKVVYLQNLTGLATAQWCEDMGASSVKRVTAGTMTVVAVVTPQPDGFDIEADADINVSGEAITWQAFEGTSRGS